MARIDGRNRMRAVLKMLPKTIRAEIRKAVLENAESVAAAQRRLVAYRTGKLRNSIEAVPASENPSLYAKLSSKKNKYPDPELAAIISAGNKEVRYSRIVEFGSAPHINAGEFIGTANPGTHPRPFFFPAFRAYVKRAKQRINKAARKGIKEGLR